MANRAERAGGQQIAPHHVAADLGYPLVVNVNRDIHMTLRVILIKSPSLNLFH
jgi:hypothetical protein